MFIDSRNVWLLALHFSTLQLVGLVYQHID